MFAFLGFKMMESYYQGRLIQPKKEVEQFGLENIKPPYFVKSNPKCVLCN
jgi:hypothetical protein